MVWFERIYMFLKLVLDSFLVHVRAKPLQSFDRLRPPWTITPQAPLSMRFSRQEYWSVYLLMPK